jgi:CheY-like chemotaxis protein
LDVGKAFPFNKKATFILNKYHNIKEIILIDDDPVQHLLCKRILKFFSEEFQIKVFFNGLEALCFLKDRIPDPMRNSKTLIFLDLNMPVMNGFEFLEKYRDLDKVITGNDHLVVLSSTIQSCDKLIAIDFSDLRGIFEKPLTKETLERIFESIDSQSIPIRTKSDF